MSITILYDFFTWVHITFFFFFNYLTFLIIGYHIVFISILGRVWWTIYRRSNSSNWGQKSETRVSYWWRCVFLFAHVFSAKTSTHSPTWKLFLPCKRPTKKNVSLACRSIWKRPNSRQPVFRPEVPLAASTRKRPVREAKFNLKNNTGWKVNPYIHRRKRKTLCPFGLKSKWLREKNIGELDALKNQHICLATVIC